MFTDTQLDTQLAALQARTPGQDVRFVSAADFKTRFFARAHAAAAVIPKATKKKPHERRSWMGILQKDLGAVDCSCVPSLAKKAFASGSDVLESISMSRAISADAPEPFMDLDRLGTLPADFNTEEFRVVGERPFVAVARNPLSTFGADVDTAGYTAARRMIMEENSLPPPEAVRIDEFLNYFRYAYGAPADGQDLAPHFECAAAPWNPAHRLLLVGIQAREIAKDNLPPAHYVFLIDNSGSMCDVMAMVKEALTILIDQLRPQDKVSLVTYGGEVSTLMEGGQDKAALRAAVEKLDAGGFTPGAEAIQRAYALARAHFIRGGNNRIVLVTDGDFNVGASSEAALASMVEKERGQGIYLSVIGAGCGNYKDNRMKMLANKGDGNYIYIDTPDEARRAFTQGIAGQMFTIAHDAKFQIEFNPARVHAYRLLGYELRDLQDSEFRDDTKDAGEIGVGQQVTALYELVMSDAPAAVKAAALPDTPPLRYSSVTAIGSDELLTCRLRYLPPKGGEAVEQEHIVTDATEGANIAWAATVAEFALLLRDSKYKGDATYESLLRHAKATLNPATDDDRLGFIVMATRAAKIAKRK